MRIIVAATGVFPRDPAAPLSSTAQLYAQLDRRPEVCADTSSLATPPLRGIKLQPHQKESVLWMRGQEESSVPPLWHQAASGLWLHATGLVSVQHPCPHVRSPTLTLTLTPTLTLILTLTLTLNRCAASGCSPTSLASARLSPS